MSFLSFFLIVFSIGLGTGLIGSLTGLGGGIFLTPFLVLLLGVEPPYALATSLIAVICTSCGASIPFLKEKLVNYRIGFFLETAAIIGAPIGAALALKLPHNFLFLLLAFLLFYCSYTTVKGNTASPQPISFSSDPLAVQLNLPSQYTLSGGEVTTYPVRNLKSAWATMLGAGVLSGILGIGSGSLKVLAMDKQMGLPYKVSTATSNFMIGLTAMAGLGVYWRGGFFAPELVLPIIPGVLIGSHLGAKIVRHIPVTRLRWFFAFTLFIFATQLCWKGFFHASP